MVKVNPPIETSAVIKVIGVGGSGKNAVNHMIASGVEGVEYICMNADAQDLDKSNSAKKVSLGRNLTKGLGTGMDPEKGRQAAEETKAEIQEAIKGAEMVFVACGMGGGTGTGASPIIARAAKEQGILTIGVVSRPFSFEGPQRKRIADRGLEELRKEVDALLVLSNDQLLATIQPDTTFNQAFKIADDILKNAVQGISQLITTPGIINTDFADIQKILRGAGAAFMGVGVAKGEDRAKIAANMAINSALLDTEISGAKGVLFSITGGDDIKMLEIEQVGKIITESIDPNANVIFGSYHDSELEKGELKVTVIAAGFAPSGKQQIDPRSNSNIHDRSAKIPMGDVSMKQPPKDEVEVEQIDQVKVDVSFDDFDTQIADDTQWNTIPAFLNPKKRHSPLQDDN